MLFAELIGVFVLDGGVRVTRLPDASVVHLFEVFCSMEVEEV